MESLAGSRSGQFGRKEDALTAGSGCPGWSREAEVLPSVVSELGR